MHALVADLAVAVFPEVVPVVMDVEPGLLAVHVDHVLVVGRRPLPQGPVQIFGHRSRFAVADRAAIAVLVNVAARFDDLADEAVVDQLHVANERRVGAALGAVLDDAVVLFGGGHKLPAFINVVRHRLLDIDILARLTAPRSPPARASGSAWRW